ncbi:MAG: flippase-like domain-containing protein [Synergistaceae bacterium]|nr:flippase-like domain-containing protein [Synergistaceae bacterium]
MTVRKGISFFVFFVLISMIAIVCYTADTDTYLALKNANIPLLFCAFALVVLGWTLDSIKFMTLSLAAGEKLSFKDTMTVVLVNYFGCAITPMQSGGGPFQVYMLYQKGVAVGKSVAVTLVRTIFTLVILALVVPFAMSLDESVLDNYRYLSRYLYFIFAFVVASVALIIASIVKPSIIKFMVEKILKLINKCGFIKAKRLTEILQKLYNEIDIYNSNMKEFVGHGKKWVIISFLVAVCHMFVYMSVMPVVILATGFSVNFLQCLIAEALFLFVLYFVPTPGASGIAECGAATICAIFMPLGAAGITAILWRMISEYTGIALGAIVMIKSLGLSDANDLLAKSKKKEKFITK